MNHFDELDREGPGSDIEPPNFLTWGNIVLVRMAHMGPEFSWSEMIFALPKPRRPCSTASHFPCAVTARLSKSWRGPLHVSLQAYLGWGMLGPMAGITHLWTLGILGSRRVLGSLVWSRLEEPCTAQGQTFRSSGGNWQKVRKCKMTGQAEPLSLYVSHLCSVHKYILCFLKRGSWKRFLVVSLAFSCTKMEALYSWFVLL